MLSFGPKSPQRNTEPVVLLESLEKIKKKDKKSKIKEPTFDYPILVSNSIRILSLGKVEFKRPAYHSKTNLFPIGFKSVRNYTSMVNVEDKCDYICEILDGGEQPNYRVTCEDDPTSPIEGKSTSDIWGRIQKAINAQKHGRISASISGPK